MTNNDILKILKDELIHLKNILHHGQVNKFDCQIDALYEKILNFKEIADPKLFSIFLYYISEEIIYLTEEMSCHQNTLAIELGNLKKFQSASTQYQNYL